MQALLQGPSPALHVAHLHHGLAQRRGIGEAQRCLEVVHRHRHAVEHLGAARAGAARWRWWAGRVGETGSSPTQHAESMRRMPRSPCRAPTSTVVQAGHSASASSSTHLSINGLVLEVNDVHLLADALQGTGAGSRGTTGREDTCERVRGTEHAHPMPALQPPVAHQHPPSSILAAPAAPPLCRALPGLLRRSRGCRGRWPPCQRPRPASCCGCGCAAPPGGRSAAVGRVGVGGGGGGRRSSGVRCGGMRGGWVWQWMK